jgi:hypothetical protein
MDVKQTDCSPDNVLCDCPRTLPVDPLLDCSERFRDDPERVQNGKKEVFGIVRQWERVRENF